MSQKINPKNLSYDTTLPPFLARLRGQADASSRDGPDPMLAARRRPARLRTDADDEEDAPLVVDEGGNAVGGVSVGRDGTVTEGGGGDGGVAVAEDGDGERAEGESEGPGRKNGEKVAEIGAGRKRKVGRVVGGTDDADARDGDGGQDKGKERKRPSEGGSGGTGTVPAPKTKRKAKKIKLSFGDDEG